MTEQNIFLVESIKKVIENNNVYETSDEITQMYRVGNNEAMIVVTRDKFGQVSSVFCKLNDKYKTFSASVPNEKEFAIDLAHACSVKSIKMNPGKTPKMR